MPPTASSRHPAPQPGVPASMPGLPAVGRQDEETRDHRERLE
jgi:hypothetical protein